MPYALDLWRCFFYQLHAHLMHPHRGRCTHRRLATAIFIFASSSFTGTNEARGTTLDLNTAIALAQERAPAARAAAQRVFAAEGKLYQASRWQNPVLELRGENWRVNSNFEATEPPLDFFATITQPMQLAGKRGKRQAVAQAQTERARERARWIRQQVGIEAATSFLALARASSELAVLGDALARIGRLRDVVARRVAEGRSAESELLKLQTELARWQSAVFELQSEQAIALTNLRRLLAEPDLTADAVALPPVSEPPAGDEERLAQQALQQHPVYREALAERERASRALDLERARRIPDPAFTAGYKRTAGRDTLVAGVVIPLPIFDTNWGNVQSSVAELAAANAELDSAVARLLNKLVALLARWRREAARARSLEKDVVEPAAAVLHAARVSFEEGSGDTLSLVDAERVYVEASRAAVAARANACSFGAAWQILFAADHTP